MPASSLSILTRIDCSCEDLFTCLYNLSALDIQILTILLRSKEHRAPTLEYIRKQVDRDKGTVFRSLQKLVGLGFSTKQTMTLKKGGYYHVYEAVDINTIEKNVDQRLKEIEASLNKIRIRFRGDIKKIVTGQLI